jgi:hypothetical protein
MFSEKIETFMNDFKSIFVIINNTTERKYFITCKVESLKIKYNQLLKQNNKKLFLICLDSFFYQYKYLFTELEQIDISRKMVINRMYCEYYKLYKNILNYFEEIKLNYDKEKENIRQFPIYKDLEPLYEYSSDDINIIFNNIIILLTILNDYVIKNDEIICNYNQEYKIGFSIFNFINTMKNENSIIDNQKNLFIDFIYFFIYSQKKYNEQIFNRYSDLLKNIDDILLSQELLTSTVISTKNIKNDLSNNFLILFDEQESNV